MPRPVTARPADEHLAVLTRLYRQVNADEVMPSDRKTRIMDLLGKLTHEFQVHMNAANGSSRKKSQPPLRRAGKYG